MTSSDRDFRPGPTPASPPKIAVLIPCYNEERTVGSVVADFRAALPEAQIWVFDNASTDGTAAAAREAGARVVREPRRGKGYVVQSMFRTVVADAYLMVDGDATYPASAARDMLRPVLDGEADMVLGTRLRQESGSDIRPMNRFGNRVFLWIFQHFFGVRIGDLLTGYRAFSAELVRTIPIFGGGFEIEAELTIKAHQRGFRIVEVPVTLVGRPEGSQSKIRLFRDGFIILDMMLTLARDYKPLTIFGTGGLLLFLGSAALGLAAVSTADGGAASAFGFGAIALFAAAAASTVTGLILHTVARHFQELDYSRRRGSGGPPSL